MLYVAWAMNKNTVYVLSATCVSAPGGVMYPSRENPPGIAVMKVADTIVFKTEQEAWNHKEHDNSMGWQIEPITEENLFKGI